jgi:hypothetical protein
MTALSPPFSSLDVFREAFVSGLEPLLGDEQGVGPLILVLANAAADPWVHDRLWQALERRFDQLAQEYRRVTPGEPLSSGAGEDIAIFRELAALGLDEVGAVRKRRLDAWEVQFNPLRALRPARAARERPATVRAPFDTNGFHFNKPFLRRETFWAGCLDGAQVDLLYNKFPFVRLHGLWVPDRDAQEPQLLTQARHRAIWDVGERLAPALPGVGFGYNSYAAYASVNHLHFQMFMRENPLPVALDRWRHNGGSDAYPACCEVYGDPSEAWERIDDLHGRNNAYNLVYLPGCLYCLPRRRQGTYTLPTWCAGQAWYEMAGGVVVFNHHEFASLQAEDVSASLAATVGDDAGPGTPARRPSI